jgi:hypothetical protein
MQYAPLSFLKNEFRLITIQPCEDFSDPICLSLGIYHLEQPPSYQALSYTWGNPEATVPVEINGCELQVTTNLADALRQLRAKRVELMWIDALCMYPDRYRTKCCRNLRFEPQFCEGWFRTSLSTFILQFRRRVALLVLRLNMITYPCFETARISPDKDLSPSLGARRGSNYFASLSSVHTHELVWAPWSWFGDPLQSGARL